MWDSLPADVLAELTDPLYINMSHHKKATYGKGCRGPLCKKAERDEARAANKALAEVSGRVYKPRWTTAQARDPELAAIARWHQRQRDLRFKRECVCGCDCQAQAAVV